jgi:hypothetical protein
MSDIPDRRQKAPPASPADSPVRFLRPPALDTGLPANRTSEARIDLPLLSARAELNRRGDPHIDWLDYVRNNAIDIATVCRFAGLIAVTHCVFYGRRFDFADPGEREAEPAAVIEALGDDGETVVDLVAWPLEAPDRFASLFGDVLLLGADRVGNPATYFAGQHLQLFKTPLSWLQADCAGAVIINPHGARFVLRRAVGPIAGEDIDHARAIQKLTHLPPQRVLAPLRAA